MPPTPNGTARAVARTTAPLAAYRVPHTDAVVYLRRPTAAEFVRLGELSEDPDPSTTADKVGRLVAMAALLIGDAQNRRLFGDTAAEHAALAAALPFDGPAPLVAAGVRLAAPDRSPPAPATPQPRRRPVPDPTRN